MNNTKADVYTAATGGTKLTFDGTDNKFSAAQLPKELYVQGTTASDDMKDVTLTLTAQDLGNLFDSVKFTVLWVEISWKRLSTEEISTDNDRREAEHGLCGTYNLGINDYQQGGQLWRGWGYEIIGSVYPLSFQSAVTWEQDREARWYENDSYLSSQTDFTANFPGSGTGNDGPDPYWQDSDPQSNQSNGKVYFLDSPGLWREAKPVNTTRRARTNFRVVARYTGDIYSTQRCSLIWAHYVRFSMKQTAAPNGNTWGALADVAGDNDATSGSFTKLSWDLNSPSVTGITPNNGTNNGTVTITNLAGTSFVKGATVKLSKFGEGDIIATDIAYVDPTKITCKFDLTGAATGQWNLVVVNPRDTPLVKTNFFTVNNP
jgi:hypothetical protein